MSYFLYTGGEFVPLDDDTAAIDGDGASPPDDTYLANSLRSNAIHLTVYGPKISWAPYTLHSDDLTSSSSIRPYASYQWASALAIPWLVGQSDTLSKLTTRLLYRASDGQLEGRDSYVRVGLGVPGSSTFKSVEAVLPYTGDWVAQEVDLEPSKGQGITPLSVSFKGDIGNAITTTGVSTAIRLPGRSEVWVDSALYARVTSVAPNTTNQSLQVTALEYDNGAEPNDLSYYDHIYVQGGGASSSPSRAAVYSATPLSGSVPDAVSRRNVGYVQLKSLEFQETFTYTETTPQVAYRAKLPVRGADDLQFAIKNRHKHNRPRIICLGPKGQALDFDDTEFWPPDYRLRSTYLEAGAGPYLLLGDGGHVDTLDPVVKVLVYVLPYVVYKQEQDGVSEALDKATLASWTFTASAVRWDGGPTPLDIGSVSAQQTLSHMTLMHSSAPCLRSLYWRTTLKGELAQEGRLFDQDWPLIQMIEVDLPITHDPGIDHGAIGIKLTASRGTVGWADDIPQANRVDSTVIMQVFGYSIWEVPRG